MKHIAYTLLTAVLLTLTSCGEDRSGEFYALIEDRMWIEETMLQNYLWADEITPVEDRRVVGSSPTGGATEEARPWPLR